MYSLTAQLNDSDTMASFLNVPQAHHVSYSDRPLTSFYGNEPFPGFQALNTAGSIEHQQSTEHSCTPVTVRISILNLQFMKLLNSKVKHQVLELQKYYFLSSSEIETGRFRSLNSANSNHLVMCSINAHYDQKHNELIARIEHSLTLVEQRQPKAQKRAAVPSTSEESSSPPADSKPPSKVGSTNVAHRIMNNWYERNSEHPYPSYDTAEVMAKAGGITVEQVKKWFANRRLRLGNTKHITHIAKRRKRSRTVSQDDILFTGAAHSE